MKTRDYIRESAAKQVENLASLHHQPLVFVQPFINSIDLKYVLDRLERIVPEHLVEEIDGIYVGDFKLFDKDGKNFNAMFKDGVIYVSNLQDSEDDLIDDILHELAHALENKYSELIYDDGRLESEFLAKRKTLFYLVDKPNTNMLLYLNPEYDAEFDDHLYKDLGYDYLRNISAGLFYSPYSITSLREYWANGFENYLLGNEGVLKDMSPLLYEKITNILDTNEEK